MNRPTVWEQIVERKAQYIGGRFGEQDSIFGAAPIGVIGDIRLVTDAKTGSTTFFVDGAEGSEHSGFSINVAYHGFGGDGIEGRIMFHGTYCGGDTFWIETASKAVRRA